MNLSNHRDPWGPLRVIHEDGVAHSNHQKSLHQCFLHQGQFSKVHHWYPTVLHRQCSLHRHCNQTNH
ncbi:MAG: hypothetical protein ACTSVO_02600 [Candidatus Heimdallarchaeaceae archaeon]